MKLHHLLYSPHLPETVLLLHGLGSASTDWELQLPALTPHYRVLAPDARGHGCSLKPAGPYTIAQMAGDVIALLDDLQIESAHVVGLSLGGCMALQMAIVQPHRVRSLVLVNSFAHLRPAGGSALRYAWRRVWALVWALQVGDMRAVGEPLLAGLFPKPEQAELRRIGLERFVANNSSHAAYRASLAAVLRFDVRHELNRVACPTIVVAGDRDLTVSMRCKEELQRGISGAELVIIPDSGHGTPFDQAEGFNEVVVGFLESTSRRQALTSPRSGQKAIC